MKLAYNSFNKISGFSKEEMLDVKEKVSNYKEKKIEESEFIFFIEDKFPITLVNFSVDYVKNIEIFIESYLLNSKKPDFEGNNDYTILISEILKDSLSKPSRAFDWLTENLFSMNF